MRIMTLFFLLTIKRKAKSAFAFCIIYLKYSLNRNENVKVAYSEGLLAFGEIRVFLAFAFLNPCKQKLS